MRLPRRWRRQRTPRSRQAVTFPASGESCPPWPVRLAALRTADAVKLAWLDGRRGDVAWLLTTAERDELEEIAREFLVSWCLTVICAGQRGVIRDHVAAEARRHAAMPGDGA